MGIDDVAVSLGFARLDLCFYWKLVCFAGKGSMQCCNPQRGRYRDRERQRQRQGKETHTFLDTSGAPKPKAKAVQNAPKVKKGGWRPHVKSCASLYHMHACLYGMGVCTHTGNIGM